MVRRMMMMFIMLAMVFVSSVAPVFADSAGTSEPSVVFDSISDREPGDTVTISGTSTLDEITIRVITPKTTVLYVNTAAGGSFSETFKLPGDAEAGEYQVVVGSGEMTSTVTFTVLEEEAEITSIDEITVTTAAGTAPELPENVTVKYSDGSSGQKAVAWDDIDSSKYANEGTFTVNGTVAGTSIKAVATVTVTSAVEPVITGIDEVKVTTAAGTAPELPENVTVKYSDGSSGQKAVAWDEIDSSKYANEGTFTVNGTVAGTSIKAVATVTVTSAAEPVITSIDEVTVTTREGTAPVMPAKVTVKYSNGSSGQKAVVWDEIDSSKYRNEGTFTVYGTVEDTSIKAVAKVTVKEKKKSSSGGGGSTTSQEPVVDADGNIKVREADANSQGQVDVEIDDSTINKALDKAVAGTDGVKTVTVSIPSVSGAVEYRQTLPSKLLSSDSADTKVGLETEFAKVEVSSNMMGNSSVEEDSITISVAKADKSKLEPELIEAIGDRPVIELGVYAGDRKIFWSNSAAPVKVTMKYEPADAEEAQNSEFITIWYIDGEGNAVTVPNARYDAATGEVAFTTTHFSMFAVAYAPKTFADLGDYEWARHSIEVLASKGIIYGTAPELYDPAANIKRGDFLMLLVNTLGIDAEFSGNFADLRPDDYYYDAVGVAKKLGIVYGTGNGRFEPETTISRQDMIVMTYNAMKTAQKQFEYSAPNDLASFADSAEVENYAKEAVGALIKSGIVHGSNNLIQPYVYATRAEIAIIMYQLYNK